jgi:hypothetical protein
VARVINGGTCNKHLENWKYLENEIYFSEDRVNSSVVCNSMQVLYYNIS